MRSWRFARRSQTSARQWLVQVATAGEIVAADESAVLVGVVFGPPAGPRHRGARVGVANDFGEPTGEVLEDASVLPAGSVNAAQRTARPGAGEDYSSRYSNPVRTSTYRAERRRTLRPSRLRKRHNRGRWQTPRR